MSLSKLLGWLFFACLLAWPGLPVQDCARPHNCCSTKKQSACACEAPSRPKLCSCKKHSRGESAFIGAGPSLQFDLQVCQLLDFLEKRCWQLVQVCWRPLRRVRGPTEARLSSFHISLPPPA